MTRLNPQNSISEPTASATSCKSSISFDAILDSSTDCEVQK
jgi:hypothetical protein